MMHKKRLVVLPVLFFMAVLAGYHSESSAALCITDGSSGYYDCGGDDCGGSGSYADCQGSCPNGDEAFLCESETFEACYDIGSCSSFTISQWKAIEGGCQCVYS